MSCSQLTKKNTPCKRKVASGNICTFHIGKKFKEEECCVCLEPFSKDFKPLFPCGHYVHMECIINESCPLCKVKVKKRKEKKKEKKKVLTIEELRQKRLEYYKL